MNHIPFEILCNLADGKTIDRNQSEYVLHLETCINCRNELDLQRSIILTAKHSGLIRPSKNFTQLVLENISPVKQKAWYTSIIQSMGNIIAMSAVLAFLIYVFTVVGTTGLQIEKPSDSRTYTLIMQLIQDGSQKFTNLITPKMPVIPQGNNQTNTILAILLAILVLFIIDKIAQTYMRRNS
jgi:hypothetical protein